MEYRYIIIKFVMLFYIQIYFKFSDTLGTGRSVYRILMEARVSMSIQTVPETHLVPSTRGTISFQGVKGPGYGADHLLPFSAEVMNGLLLYLRFRFVSP